MKALMWCLAGLMLLSAACGEDEGKKITDPADPDEGRTFCNTSNLVSLSSPEEVEAVVASGCDSLNGRVVVQGSLKTLKGLEGIKYIKGALSIQNNYSIEDISALKGLEEVRSITIVNNERLDNCQATALASTVRVTGETTIRGNMGSAICSTWP